MSKEFVLQIRVTAELKADLQVAADAAGLSLSAWVRTKLIAAAIPALGSAAVDAAVVDGRILPQRVAKKVQATPRADAIQERPTPPPGMKKSDLPRWYRENR